MVEMQLRRRGIHDEGVLRAMLEIPREEFVPAESRVMAYQDEPIHIGHGQTVSQPYMTALMAESLELTGAETVLEVGAGSGYAAAVLGAVAARVVTVEIIPALAQLALENLRRTGRDSQTAPYLVEMHGRYATPLTCLIVVWIGVPLGLQVSRRGPMMGVGLALGLVVAFFILTKLSLPLGYGGHALVAAWAPNALFGTLGAILLWRAR